MINGLDISNVNGALDVAALARQHHLGFAILKATEGAGFRDTDFPVWWQALHGLGLARGAYHFCHPSGDPVTEADHFLGYVRQHGLADADMLALDLEVTDGLPPAMVAAFARIWCGLVQSETGRAPLVYTFLSFAQEGNCAGLGNCPLWIADPSSPPGRPRVPGPWSSWAVHQYGQRGIDLDLGNYPDATAMTAALGQHGAPQPKPAPKGWTAAMIADLPVLAQGATGDDVRTVQALCCARGHDAAVDGAFGPATAAAVRAVQTSWGLSVDGTVGKLTWGVLVTGRKA